MKTVRVRKAHICSFCGDDIKKGEEAKTESTKYTRVSGIGTYWDTDYYHKTCPMRKRH